MSDRDVESEFEDFLVGVNEEEPIRQKLLAIACLPEDLWKKKAREELANCSPISNENELDMLLEHFRGDMEIRRIMLGRAVQHTGGKLDKLAPVVGAIREGKQSVHFAREYLVSMMISAIEKGNGGFFDKLAKFSESKFGEHPNYVIWEAIFDHLYEVSDLIEVTDEGKEVRASVIPGTKQLKDFVSLKKGSGRYLCLPDDDRQWSRLWVSSGAARLISKSTRGKAK